MIATEDEPQLADTEQQAIRWLIRLNEGDLSDAETIAFAEWLSADYLHTQALATAEDIFRDMTAVAKTEQAITSSPNIERLQSSPAHRPIIRQSLGYLVGVAAIWLMVVLLLPPNRTGWLDVWLSDYHTATGQQREVELADGSRVFLNTDTAIRVDYNNDNRRIILSHGEANFTVAPDTERPFIVNVDDLSVQALGTVFDVYRLDDIHTRIVVQEHAVIVRNPTGDNREVQAGQQLLQITNQPLAKVESSDVNESMAWQRQRIFINDKPLADFIQELQRYRSGKVFIAGDQLESLRVTGVFPLDDTDIVLTNICKIFGLKLTSVGPLTVLHR